MLRLLAPVGALGAAVAAFGYVGRVDPNEPGHYPVCPLLHFTGVLCPGCGGLRCAYALAHGELPAALHANALAVVAIAGFAAYWILWVVRASRGRPAALRVRTWQLWAGGVLALAFMIVRNLPLGTALAP